VASDPGAGARVPPAEVVPMDYFLGAFRFPSSQISLQQLTNSGS